jgi:hypothetical protein
MKLVDAYDETPIRYLDPIASHLTGYLGPWSATEVVSLDIDQLLGPPGD